MGFWKIFLLAVQTNKNMENLHTLELINSALLMVLGVSRKMTGPEREIVTREMMRGFNDTATAAGTKITGGQSVINEWPIIGGVANVVLP